MGVCLSLWISTSLARRPLLFSSWTCQSVPSWFSSFTPSGRDFGGLMAWVSFFPGCMPFLSLKPVSEQNQEDTHWPHCLILSSCTTRLLLEGVLVLLHQLSIGGAYRTSTVGWKCSVWLFKNLLIFFNLLKMLLCMQLAGHGKDIWPIKTCTSFPWIFSFGDPQAWSNFWEVGQLSKDWSSGSCSSTSIGSILFAVGISTFY